MPEIDADRLIIRHCSIIVSKNSRGHVKVIDPEVVASAPIPIWCRDRYRPSGSQERWEYPCAQAAYVKKSQQPEMKG